MKYIKSFEIFESSNLTRHQIMQACEFYKFEDYEVNEDLTVSVYQNHVNLSEQELNNLPFNLYYVEGSLNLSDNNLTSMSGFPLSCDDNVFCPNNKITNIEDCPKEIGGNLVLDNNKISSLIPIKDIVFLSDRAVLRVNENLLNTLEGCPNVYQLDCTDNKIKSLEHLPDGVKHLNISSNELTNIDSLPDSIYSITIEHNLITNISSTLRDMLINDRIRFFQLKNNPIHRLFDELGRQFIFHTKENILEMIDRLDEFEVIKDENKIDLISLRSLFEFCKKPFNEKLFTEINGYIY